MAILTQTVSANTAITFDISSLATSSTFLSGRESTEVNNTTTNYIDAIVNVAGITSNTGTAPTVGQSIVLYAWGANSSLATNPISTLDGVDSAETLPHASVLNSLRFVSGPTVTVATAGLLYYFQPFSVAALFGGVLPKYWGLYLAHNQTGALAAAQSTLFSFNGVTYTST